MKALLIVPAAVLVGVPCWVSTAALVSADAAPGPPFVDHTHWVRVKGLTSLRVFPTPAGRADSRRPGTAADADEAWAEVLRLSPDAGTPGMRAQFLCHWQFAETAEPGKASWNLEPWRPVVDDDEMIAFGCNPGGYPGPF